MEHKFVKARNFFTQISRNAYLYKNLWQEGTTALLHAPRSVDKTSEALTIAADIAVSGREVLYVNTEERVDRYAEIAGDSDNLYVFTPEYDSPDDNSDYADIVFDAVIQAVSTTSIKTFVVDSVNRIAALSLGKNASPSYVMKRLVAMQRKYRLSLLVIADDAGNSVNTLRTLAATEITLPEEKGNDLGSNSAPQNTNHKNDVSPVEDRSSEHSPQQSRSERRARRRHRKQQARRFRQRKSTVVSPEIGLREYFIGDEPLPEDSAHWDAFGIATSPASETGVAPASIHGYNGMMPR